MFRVSLTELLRRFPLSIASAVVAASMLSYMTRKNFNTLPDTYTAVVLTGILGIIFFAALAFFAQRKYGIGKKYYITQLLGVIPLGLFFWSTALDLNGAFSERAVVLFFLMLAASFSFMLVSAYVMKKDELAFWQFAKWLLLRMFLALFSAIVLFIAFAIAIFSINALFNARISEDYYFILWQWIAIVFSPVFVLFGARPTLEEYDNDKEYPEIVRKFTHYILSPVLVVYFLILYAYIAKIAFIQRAWPDGGVALPIIIYSSVVVLTMLLTFPWYVRGQKSAAIKTLKYIFLSLIPILPLYFMALGVRIGEYGITESRYAGIAVGIWFAFVVLTALLTKFNRIRVFFGALALLLFVSGVGPWSMFNVSYISQSNQLESVIRENQLLNSDGLFDVDAYELYNQDKTYVDNDVRNVARYLASRHSFKRVDGLFPRDITISQTDEERRREIEEMLSVYNYNNRVTKDYFYYHSADSDQVVDIEGADVLLNLDRNISNSLTVYNANGYVIKAVQEGEDPALVVTTPEGELQTSIASFIYIAAEEDNDNTVGSNVPLRIELQNETTSVSVVAYSLSGTRVEGKLVDMSIMGYALVTHK